jgi:hypothetical protein
MGDGLASPPSARSAVLFIDHTKIQDMKQIAYRIHSSLRKYLLIAKRWVRSHLVISYAFSVTLKILKLGCI